MEGNTISLNTGRLYISILKPEGKEILMGYIMKRRNHDTWDICAKCFISYIK